MSGKTAKGTASEAVSESDNVSNPQALQTTGDGDISGSLMLALSEGARDEVLKQFLETAHRVLEGFDDLTKPGDILKTDRAFDVIDAATITDYVDKDTGEVKTKHLFKLQFPEGDTRMVMQSTAPPRAAVADLFTLARQTGQGIVLGPYKFGTKNTGRIQPAIIFVQQPGFKLRSKAA